MRLFYPAHQGSYQQGIILCLCFLVSTSLSPIPVSLLNTGGHEITPWCCRGILCPGGDGTSHFVK